jgi:Raf kinase inhibitor-like YbhB/YbcL family protein
MKLRLLASAALALGVFGVSGVPGRAAANLPMQLTSTKFLQGAEIPVEYTCDGQSLSPPLSWSDVPQGSKSFALIVDDPDAPDPKAPKKDVIHWVIYDLPAPTRGLSEGVQGDDLPTGAMQGTNDMGKVGYSGPCPPVGRHRYVFGLYALDTVITGLQAPTKLELDRAMSGHVVARAELVGTYEKHRK